MSDNSFEEIVGAAKIADKYGLIFERGVVKYGTTMKQGGVIKFIFGQGKCCICFQVEFIKEGDEWNFYPQDTVGVAVAGVGLKETFQFLERVSTIGSRSWLS